MIGTPHGIQPRVSGRHRAGRTGGAVRFVRRELGVTAFGINHFTLPAGATGREHDEIDTGQEEVIVVLAGSGTLRVDGNELLLRPGLRPARSGVDARTRAGPDGLEFVAIGSPREAPYAARGPF